MEPQVHGVFRNGHVELIDELDVPEGTEVLVTPLVPASNPAEGQMLRRGMYRGDKHITLDEFKGMRREWEGELDEFFGRRSCVDLVPTGRSAAGPIGVGDS